VRIAHQTFKPDQVRILAAVRTEHRLETYAMLHWPSGLSSEFPEPSRELSPCTWSDDATA
jgi:hypothetical protein